MLITNTPKFDPTYNQRTMDFYYWYFGTLAMFQIGGETWKTWNENIKSTLLSMQSKTGNEKGSWDPIDKWSGYGGRVYTTSMAILTLEVYYRYPKLND